MIIKFGCKKLWLFIQIIKCYRFISFILFSASGLREDSSSARGKRTVVPSPAEGNKIEKLKSFSSLGINGPCRPNLIF